jgi:hypothetical protein
MMGEQRPYGEKHSRILIDDYTWLDAGSIDMSAFRLKADWIWKKF